MTTQRPYLIVSPVGSEGRTVRVFRYYDGPDSTANVSPMPAVTRRKRQRRRAS